MISYNTPHAPFGSFCSFTSGYAVSWEQGAAPNSGGFGLSLRHPAQQNVFIGWRAGMSEWNLLPFLRTKGNRAAEFTSSEAGGDSHNEAHRIIGEAELSRSLGLATDSYAAGPVRVVFHSPFERIQDWDTLAEERKKTLCAPVVPVTCVIDNRAGTEAIDFMFGYGETERGVRTLEDTHAGLRGFAAGTSHGYAVRPQAGLRLRSGLDVFSTWRQDERGIHLLGSESALILSVPAGEIRSLPICLGFFQDGNITTGIKSSFYYTTYFNDLDEVLEFGLNTHAELVGIAEARDKEFESASLSPERKWCVAQSVHSYLASTQLLRSRGKALWVVNEGEYRMLNTFDLQVDHLFFELAWWPWAVRSTLDLFASRYAYTDTLHTPDGRKARGGITFTHDMGVDNQFTPKAMSSYELPNLTDCFSQMSSEQLVNWICCAVTYAERTGDTQWLASKLKLLRKCADSLRRRDDPQAAKRIGIIRWDSDRCGPAGAEITTYDSLDISLGQARNNLYLAVKTMAAWALLSKAFGRLGLKPEAEEALATALLSARSIKAFQETESGMFPAVFEGNNQSRIIPGIEGLVFLVYLDMKDELQQIEAASGLVSALGIHLQKILKRGICLDATSGGWKLSSTSENTWLSKVFLCQYVVRELYPDLLKGEAGDAADKAHAAWLQSPSTRALAYCDQVRSTDGYPFGSKHYPRGVSAWLWLDGRTC